eukprot:TRINITY_DN3521_c0_g1_i1.p1 TRINITY_DN3521_c0_g1~~TRINITY_DN3521_c0_g1_i1.p1  ORF type:complete len:865 (-),score=220.03 TRINITY_DN3521_c0_g1_i1:78-2306(-)
METPSITSKQYERVSQNEYQHNCSEAIVDFVFLVFDRYSDYEQSFVGLVEQLSYILPMFFVSVHKNFDVLGLQADKTKERQEKKNKLFEYFIKLLELDCTLISSYFLSGKGIEDQLNFFSEVCQWYHLTDKYESEKKALISKKMNESFGKNIVNLLQTQENVVAAWLLSCMSKKQNFDPLFYDSLVSPFIDGVFMVIGRKILQKKMNLMRVENIEDMNELFGGALILTQSVGDDVDILVRNQDFFNLVYEIIKNICSTLPNQTKSLKSKDIPQNNITFIFPNVAVINHSSGNNEQKFELVMQKFFHMINLITELLKMFENLKNSNVSIKCLFDLQVAYQLLEVFDNVEIKDVNTNIIEKFVQMYRTFKDMINSSVITNERFCYNLHKYLINFSSILSERFISALIEFEKDSQVRDDYEISLFNKNMAIPYLKFVEIVAEYDISAFSEKWFFNMFESLPFSNIVQENVGDNFYRINGDSLVIMELFERIFRRVMNQITNDINKKKKFSEWSFNFIEDQDCSCLKKVKALIFLSIMFEEKNSTMNRQEWSYLVTKLENTKLFSKIFMIVLINENLLMEKFEILFKSFIKHSENDVLIEQVLNDVIEKKKDLLLMDVNVYDDDKREIGTKSQNYNKIYAYDNFVLKCLDLAQNNQMFAKKFSNVVKEQISVENNKNIINHSYIAWLNEITVQLSKNIIYSPISKTNKNIHLNRQKNKPPQLKLVLNLQPISVQNTAKDEKIEEEE